MIERQQLALADSLKRLRKQAAYQNAKDFADAIGWQASKVSRIETGTTLPGDSDLVAWLDIVAAPDEVAVHLRDELRDLRIARANWRRRLLRGGHAPEQKQLADLERAAARIEMVDFFLVPGLVQTADYARAVFTAAAAMHDTPQDTEAAIRARIQRQDVLYDSAKQIDVLIGESALRYPVADPAVLVAQIVRLDSLIGLPNVRLGVIPLGVRLPVITLHGYMTIDDQVIVEINHSDVTVTDEADVALYRQISTGLWSAAVEGDAARRFLASLAATEGKTARDHSV